MKKGIKSIIITGTVATLAVLSAVGILNMDGIIPLVQYANNHLGWAMASVFFGSLTLTFFILPIVAGVAVEVPLWESNTRIGFALSNAVYNARGSIVGFISFGLAGGGVLFMALWGAVNIICA